MGKPNLDLKHLIGLSLVNMYFLYLSLNKIQVFYD
jgi:hypothetical protein